MREVLKSFVPRKGRRARIAGTGLEVWELISTFKSVKQNVKKLCKAYYWLTESEIQWALNYYLSYPQEIDRLIQKNISWTPGKLREMYPITNPKNWTTS